MFEQSYPIDISCSQHLFQLWVMKDYGREDSWTIFNFWTITDFHEIPDSSVVLATVAMCNWVVPVRGKEGVSTTKEYPRGFIIRDWKQKFGQKGMC